MKASVYSVDGKKTKELTLPTVFSEDYKPQLIARAVIALQTTKLQPKGVKPTAGMDTSAEYVGRRRGFRASIGRGFSHLPRIKPGGGGVGDVRKVPQAVKGRRAHPPKVEKKIVKQINKKERKAALRSCIAATANKEVVKGRGYSLDGVKELPLVIEDKFEKIGKTKDALKVLGKIGLKPELEKKKKILIIGNAEIKSCRNIPGVEVSTVESLNAEKLAPGTHAGILAVWTEKAVKKVGEEYGG